MEVKVEVPQCRSAQQAIEQQTQTQAHMIMRVLTAPCCTR